MFHFVVKHSNMWLNLIKGSENNLDAKIFYKKFRPEFKALA